ncbi:hypothetical protein ACT7V1_001222 [Salmonella enterica subsp. enterica]|nr:hypothetical protein [Citrobacter freundii]QLO06657.1 hypothetical protein HV141_24430 [Citrobacter freundii]
MYTNTNARLQRLGIEHHVPAWTVMVDRKRSAWENTSREVLVLLNKKGEHLLALEETSLNAWGKMAEAMVEYAATDECAAEWKQYESEGRPIVGLFGIPL